ncbi:hypothetical protein DFH09DRAFT_429605 [Mycena vulgaris]|nr:hypothetical protein DFH09DRAFT_429605 [Mycena vulgaris]
MGAPLPPRIDSTFGVDFIGVVVAGALWGITSMQAYKYLISYRLRDSWKTQTMVLTVFVLDTLHQISVSHAIYVYLITDFENPELQKLLVWSLLLQILLCALVSFIVQCFFTWRIWILSHKNIEIVALILVLVLAELLSSIVYFSQTWSLDVLANLPKLTTLGHLFNVFAAAGDFMITGTLVYFLQSAKSGGKRTDVLLNRLILFSLNTGLLTSLCSLCSLIMLAALPETFAYIAFYTILARFYAISLFSTLNARTIIEPDRRGEAIAITSIRWRNTEDTRPQDDIRSHSPASLAGSKLGPDEKEGTRGA